MIEHKFSLHFAPACRSADRAENGTCNGAGQGLGRTDAMDGGTAEVGLLTAGSGREIGVLQRAFTDFQENVTGCQHNEGTLSCPNRFDATLVSPPGCSFQ
jgi:hypothetical protein